MVNWDTFKIDKQGKVTITKKTGIDESVKKEIELDLLELPTGKYFVNKKYLEKLKEISVEKLQKTSIYILVGTNMGNNREGITAEVIKKERLEEFIEQYKKH